MAKVFLWEHIDPETGEKYHHDQYHYWCPGCDCIHAFALKEVGGHHSFNGDLNNPTVSPSLVQNFAPGTMCHSFIKNGMIQFLSDCTHALANKTVELPQIEDKIKKDSI
jgi:hypothetical protein